MNCREVRAKISSYIDNELKGHSLSEFKEHIRQCSKCAKALEEILAVNKIIADIPEQKLPAGAYEELNRQLDKLDREEKVTITRPVLNWNYIMRGAVSFAVLVLAVLLVKEIRRRPEKIEPVIAPQVKESIEKKEPGKISIRKPTVKRYIPKQPPSVTQKIEEPEIQPVIPIIPEEKSIERIVQKEEPEIERKSEIVELISEKRRQLLFMGYSLGSTYNSAIVSIFRSNPESINLGLDFQLFKSMDRTGIYTNYLGFVHIGERFIQTEKLSSNWIVGAAVTTAEYTQSSPFLIFTKSKVSIGMGVISEYTISNSLSIYGKIFGVIYSKGYSFPYQVGPVFRYKRINIFTGVQGVIPVLGNTLSSWEDIGLMLSVGYLF